MMLPEGHGLTNPPSFRESLAARGPVNTNAPGLANNKNGSPGPKGNQKGPPIATTSTEELASPTSQPPLSETTLSSSDSPPPPPPAASSTASPATSPALGATLTSTSSPGLTPSSAIITSIDPTPSTIFRTSSAPAPPPVESLTTADISASRTADVSASSDGFSASTNYLVSKSPSSTLSATFYSVETTLRTTFTYTSSATAMQPVMVSYAPNGTAQSEYSAASPGQKSGIAVGTIAGFAFILTLIFLLFKWRRAELPKALPSTIRRLPGTWGNPRWLSHRQSPHAMSESLLEVEVGSSGGLAWDYQATFARPTVIEKARRPLRKSLKGLLRINPLGLNPATPQVTGVKTPSRKSFASLFHRRSTASTHHSAPSLLQDQSGSVIDPQSPPPIPPPYAALPSPQPSAMSGQSIEFAQSNTDDSPRPQTMPPQIPPQALQLPWHHRSQMTMASTQSEARSFKSVPGWVKFHYSHRLCNGGGRPEESGTALPVPTPSPGSWLMAKLHHRSQPMTASEDEKGHRMASDNGNELAGTEQVVFGPSGWKQVQMGRRISGASAHSLLAEKQEAWQI
ncbi:hypothetical protein BDZ45DRAFT_316156 [Acephala macrosclerotiorum]|nr:hypothetical protein BDZ45DRAFT_316156 [Acephala macrosclerotiorum]